MFEMMMYETRRADLARDEVRLHRERAALRAQFLSLRPVSPARPALLVRLQSWLTRPQQATPQRKRRASRRASAAL